MSARRWLIATTVMAAALAALALVIVALRGGIGDDAYPEGSPEAVVTQFVAAVIDRDVATARALLTRTTQARCSVNAFTRSVEMATIGYGASPPRWSFLLLDRKDLASGAVQLRLRIVRTEVSPPWETIIQRNESPFVLEAEDGAFLIASFDWPGPCW